MYFRSPAFLAAAAASSTKGGKPKGQGKGKPADNTDATNNRPGNGIVFKLRKRAQAIEWSGYADRFDHDATFRLSMEANGYPRILFWDNNDPLDPEDVDAAVAAP